MAYNTQSSPEIFTRIPQDAFLEYPAATDIHDAIRSTTHGLYDVIEAEVHGSLAAEEAGTTEQEIAALLGALPLDRAVYDSMPIGELNASLHATLTLPFMTGCPPEVQGYNRPDVELQTEIQIRARVKGIQDDRYDDASVSARPGQQHNTEAHEVAHEVWSAARIVGRQRADVHHAAKLGGELRYEKQASVLGVNGTPAERPRALGLFKRATLYSYESPEAVAQLQQALVHQLRGGDDIKVSAQVRTSAFMWDLYGYDALSLKTALESGIDRDPVTPAAQLPAGLRALGKLIARSSVQNHI